MNTQPIIKSSESIANSTANSTAEFQSRSLNGCPWFKQIWNLLWSSLYETQEPKVWQRRDRHTNTCWWEAYDPGTEQSVVFASELEVRIWLETLYH